MTIWPICLPFHNLCKYRFPKKLTCRMDTLNDLRKPWKTLLMEAFVVGNLCVDVDGWFVPLSFLPLEEGSVTTFPNGLAKVEVAERLLPTEKSASSPMSDGMLTRTTFVFFWRSSTPFRGHLMFQIRNQHAETAFFQTVIWGLLQTSEFLLGGPWSRSCFIIILKCYLSFHSHSLMKPQSTKKLFIWF